MFKYLLVILVFLLPYSTFGDHILIYDFNEDSQIDKFHGQTITIKDGKLRVKFPGYKDSTFQKFSCSLPENLPSDWSDYKTLEVEIHNPMNVEQEIGFGPIATGVHISFYEIQPGQTESIEVSLHHLKRYADMKQVKGLEFILRPHINKLAFPTEFLIDNITLTKMSIKDAESVRINIVKPKYRNNIYASYPVDEIIASIETELKKDVLENYTAELNFNADGKMLKSQQIDLSDENLTFSYGTLETADIYNVRLEIYDKSNNEMVNVINEKIHSLPPNTNEVVIDQENILRINGEKFLPIGIYFVGPVEDMKYIKENGFNCIAPYHPPTEEFLEYARKYDLKMMPNFVVDRNRGSVLDYKSFDEKNMAVINSELFLGYYLYDEPQPVNINPEQVKHIVDEYKQFDPFHPTYICYNSETMYYGFEYASDVMMVDSYSMPRDHGPLIEIMSNAVKAMDGKGPVWFVGQIFAHWVYNDYFYYDLPHNGRELTYDEIRAYSWMSILLGAKGIFYYNYHTTLPDVVQRIAYPRVWRGLGYIISELKALEDVILSDQSQDLQVTFQGEHVKAQIRELNGKKYVLVVNGQMDPVQCKVQTGKIEGKLYELGHCGEPVFKNDTLYVSIPAQTAKIFTNDKLLADYFEKNIPIEKYRKELKLMDDGLEEDSKNNVAKYEKGARLSASWGFPEINEKNKYGFCRTTTWNLLIDGNRATPWRLGDDGMAGKRYVWPKEKIYQGERWIEVKLAEKTRLEKIIVTITTTDTIYELKLFQDGAWNKLNVSNSLETDQYHYSLVTNVDSYNMKDFETDRIRLYFNNADDSANPPTIFEIEAIKHH